MTSEVTDAESTQALTASSKRSSPRKLEANRRNAKKSMGPKTSAGKLMSSWNSTKHGLLSKVLPSIYGQHTRQFTRLLSALRQNLQPVGTLEEVLVEKIAQEYWRLGVAAWQEWNTLESEVHAFEKTAIDRVGRYQTTINRQLYQAINQLESCW
jgi:hypothetical protein